jgi:hypothetical protein
VAQGLESNNQVKYRRYLNYFGSNAAGATKGKQFKSRTTNPVRALQVFQIRNKSPINQRKIWKQTLGLVLVSIGDH